jgi:hypothetical protein
MGKKIFGIFCIFFVTFSGLWAGGKKQSKDPAFFYVGPMLKGYPVDLITHELGRARARVVTIDEEWMIFGINQKTKATKFLKNVPFMKYVHWEREGVLEDKSLKNKKIAQKFLEICDRVDPTKKGGSSSKKGHIFQGQEGISKDMLALDRLIRNKAKAKTKSNFIGFAADDGYEDNDTFETAAELTPGTYSNLKSMDEDWYKVSVTDGQDFIASVTTSDGLYFELYDYDGNYLAGGQSYDGVSGKVFGSNLSPGDYYILVYYEGYASTYSLDIQTGDLLGEITGQVKNESDAGLEAVEVYAYSLDYDYVTEVETDSSGNYSMPIPEGSYEIYFWGPGAGNYISEWYDDKSSFDSADTVGVTANSTTSGIDAVLADGGAIAGRVTEESSGNGLDSVEIDVYDPDWNYWYGWTDGEGNYSVVGLPTGSYKVEFYPYSNHVGEWYDNESSDSTADEVNVTAGSTTSGINAVLAIGGEITGRVTDGSGNGLYDSRVRVYDLSGDYRSSAWTDEDGYYTTDGLATGNYKVHFYSFESYIPEWYDDKANFEEADEVTVAAGSTTSNINAQLETGGFITGTVDDGSGNGIGDVRVRLLDIDFNEIANAWTNTDGSYELGPVKAGACKVWFDSYYTDYASEWYNNKNSFDDADDVAVIAGDTTTGINAHLDEGGTISGRVTNVKDVGVSAVIVALYDTGENYLLSDQTYTNGYYYCWGLRSGSYKIYFDATYALGKLTSEWYNDKTSFAAANTVNVAAGEDVENINAKLSSKASIKVTSPNGGEVWLKGTTQTITWTTTGTVGAVKIQYSINGGTTYTSIISSTPNDGSHGWVVPSKPSSNCLIRVSETDDGNPTDVSNATFTIGPLITVVTPAAGATWMRGTTQNIAWTKVGAQNAYVKISLYKGTNLVSTIIASTDNDGSYDWPIASGLATDTNYQIRVITADGKISDYSDYFTIAKPSITVTSPASGTTWTRDTTQTIIWTTAGPQDAYVKIFLFKGTNNVLTISTSTENDGSSGWLIPTTLSASTNYKIKVVTADGKVSDSSDVFILN